jgi:hypothetical protein
MGTFCRLAVVLRKKMRAIVLCLALGLVAMVVSACQQRPAAVAPTGVTNFEAQASGFSPSPAEQCDGKADACTRIKFVVTTVGDQEGDTLCTIRMIGARGQEVNVDMLIANNLVPGESASWVGDFAGRATSVRSKCPAYDAGALTGVG